MDSTAFFILYLLGGVSDAVDGALARRLNAVTVTGARLDSAADMVLAALTTTYLVCRTTMFGSAWVWWATGAIVAVRFANLLLIRCRFGLWGSTHTVLNKIAGALFFAAVPVAWLYGGDIPSWIIGSVAAIAFAASVEESAIVLTSKVFDPDRKSFIISKKVV